MADQGYAVNTLTQCNGYLCWVKGKQCQKKTVIVTGHARGGTSALAWTLQHLGVPMFGPGAGLVPFLEDVEMRVALKTRNSELLRSLVEARNETYDLWGFKLPNIYSYIEDVLPYLENPHIISAFRDMVAVAGRQFDVDQLETEDDQRMRWADIRHEMAKQFEMAKSPDIPHLLVSYERMLQEPQPVVDYLQEFLDISPTDHRKKLAVDHVREHVASRFGWVHREWDSLEPLTRRG